MQKYPYFKKAKTCCDGCLPPAPLSYSVERIARFEEVDSLGIVWHGRYPSYFEDARVAFGEQYGIGYLDFYREHIIAPIKQMYIDYLAPILFAQRCHITATLHWSEAARLNFSYMIHDSSGTLLTSGYTVQLFLLEEGKFCMTQPDFYAAFCEKWKAGTLI